MKTIHIIGDWVADWNLERPANLPEGYFDGSLQTQLHLRAGGAWYLEHLIKNVACRDLDKKKLSVVLTRPSLQLGGGMDSDGSQRSDVAHAYSVWWKQQRLASGKKDDEVWRIARFAGCQKSTTSTKPMALKSSDLLVIDDLGLGFSDDPQAMKHIIALAGSEAPILLKHGVRPDASGLLPKLLASDFAKRLHVVVSANALRRRNAELSRALSWDKALEDIEREFAEGPSSRDLARCATVVVHFGLAGAAVFKFGELHRFYFLPDELEGVWEDEHPGTNFGTGSVLAACLARHIIDQASYPLFFAVAQALAAQRIAHENGAGAKVMEIDEPFGVRGNIADSKKNPAAACIAPPKEKDAKDAQHIVCVQSFRAAWNPNKIAVWPNATDERLKKNRLLFNITGTTSDSLLAKALDVVIHGPKKALLSVPKATYEKYLTCDRDEIESINEVRRLILEYKSNPEDKRPLSIAVFGAPGSGKSFAVKQVAKAIFGKDKEPLDFNLTQIKTPEDLHRAFHQVRDASIRHEVPLVFWDEFDTAGLRWLADFLAPMQDADFFDGSHKHPFGKCIFIFAGGTRSSFDEFKQWPREKHEMLPPEKFEWDQKFKDLKGPDFISRLRGFVNVKSPNPMPHADEDPAFVLRRALILRSELERNYPHLIHPDTKRAAISPNVLHAFLSVERYEHGARSIAALISMSALTKAKSFTVSALPAVELLKLHVSADFFEERLKAPIWPETMILTLAKAGYEGYCKGTGAEANWDDVKGEALRRNLDPVPHRLLELQRLGFKPIPKCDTKTCPILQEADIAALIDQLAEPEHRIWLSDRLSTGFEKDDKRQDWLRLNTDIKPFAEITDRNQNINICISAETIAAFEKANFCLVKAEAMPTTQKL